VKLETVAAFGRRHLCPNAAGKTTLLKLIAGIERVTAVQVQGHDVVRERAAALRQFSVALEGGPPQSVVGTV
jgi:ABC-type multidrug transport system ATPase subunit